MLRYIPMLVIFSSACVYGQAEFGIKSGLNVSDIVMINYINPDVESDLTLKLGLHAGLFVNGMLSERMGMTGELLYSDKGVKGINNIHLHYINLPILFQYQLTDRIFAEVGPELGYLFSAFSKHGNESGSYNNKFDLALDAGLRFNVQKFIFGLRYSMGFFSVREHLESFGGSEKVKYQNRVLQVSLGYKLWILE